MQWHYILSYTIVTHVLCNPAGPTDCETLPWPMSCVTQLVQLIVGLCHESPMTHVLYNPAGPTDCETLPWPMSCVTQLVQLIVRLCHDPCLVQPSWSNWLWDSAMTHVLCNPAGPTDCETLPWPMSCVTQLVQLIVRLCHDPCLV